MSAFNITSIPELLKSYKSMGKLHLASGWSEVTIQRYRFDKNMDGHVVINGKLYTRRATSKPSEEIAELLAARRDD